MKRFILILLMMSNVAFASLDRIEIYNSPKNPYEKVEISLPNNQPIVHQFGRFDAFESKVIEIPTPINLEQEKANYPTPKSFYSPNDEVSKDPTQGRNAIISYDLYYKKFKNLDESEGSIGSDVRITRFFMKYFCYPKDRKMILIIKFYENNLTEELEISTR